MNPLIDWLDRRRQAKRAKELAALNRADQQLADVDARVRDRRIRERRWRDKWGRRFERLMLAAAVGLFVWSATELDNAQERLERVADHNCERNTKQDDALERLVRSVLAAGGPTDQGVRRVFREYVQGNNTECPDVR